VHALVDGTRRFPRIWVFDPDTTRETAVVREREAVEERYPRIPSRRLRTLAPFVRRLCPDLDGICNLPDWSEEHDLI